jgi:hypothetical protein
MNRYEIILGEDPKIEESIGPKFGVIGRPRHSVNYLYSGSHRYEITIMNVEYSTFSNCTGPVTQFELEFMSPKILSGLQVRQRVILELENKLLEFYVENIRTQTYEDDPNATMYFISGLAMRYSVFGINWTKF